MAFRPVMPGILSGVPVDAGGAFSITAGTSGPAIGYLSALAASELGTTPWGSASGDSSADGGTVEGVYYDGSSSNTLLVRNGSQGVTNVDIDASSYATTFLTTTAGYDVYSFGSSTSLFANGVTYTVEAT